MRAFATFVALRRTRIGAALIAAAAIVVVFTTLTNHLGYASALTAGVWCSLVSAVVSAGWPAALRSGKERPSAGAVLLVPASFAASGVATFALAAGVAGFFTAACTPGEGALFYLLVALPGPLLAASLGAVFGAATRSNRLATTLAVLLVPGFIVWSLIRFYATPVVFAYDPFFGFFPGAIYDETVAATSTLLTYRLGTCAAIAATAGLFTAMWDRDTAQLHWRGSTSRWVAWTISGLGAAVMLAVYVAGVALGHRSTSESIARALGGRLDGPRCTVVYARTIPGREARLTARDCEVRLAQIESFFGTRLGGRVTVFLFSDAEQKQMLMGAAETYIAKPWRHEVYLQYAPFPHPVLKHELAHVVAGAMAPGPLDVTVRAALLPLPGLIEGAAVAASWDSEGDVSPHQWSRAMLEAGLLPSMQALTGLGFYTHAAGTAYTAAGSFVRWLVERRGRARFRELYRHGDFEAAYGEDEPTLEREWRAFLHTVEVPDAILARARARFRRAALIARVCPNETAALLNRGSTRLAVGDARTARDELTEVVHNDPTDLHARTLLAEAWARLGDVPRALAVTQDAVRALGPAAGVRLQERAADVVWRWRGADAARDLYAPLDPNLLDEDDARTLEVKRWALGLLGPIDPEYTRAVQDLLIGDGDIDPDPLATSVRLALSFHEGARSAPPSAPAAYLIARQLLNHHRAAYAAALLDSVDETSLPTERIRGETRRLDALAHYESGDLQGARTRFESIVDNPLRPQGIRDAAADWVDRIRREQFGLRE